MLTPLLLLLASAAFYLFYWRRRGLPPGPTPWPLVGNILSLLREPPGVDVLRAWRERYGAVFTVWYGNQPVVTVADYELIMATFHRDADSYAGRGNGKVYWALLRGGDCGVLLAEGDLWREQRRFTLTVFRELGLGKNLMQERILAEIETLTARIEREATANKRVVAVDDLIDISVGSIINSLLFGYLYDSEARVAEFVDLKQRAHTFTHIAGHPVQQLVREYTKVCRHLPYFRDRFNNIKSAVDGLIEFFRERVDAQRRELDAAGTLDDAAPTNFVVAFLQEWRRKERASESHHFSDHQLVILLFDLWVTGQETTSNTLGWAIAFLLHNPQAQRRAHAELDRVIGADRPITSSDKASLIYMQALVQEVQRVANILPLNINHRTARNVRIEGYDIPAGTWCVPAIAVVLSDPRLYENADAFVPERFLNADGTLRRVDELIPFSVGKRACLGESLARAENFLILANLLNRFEFTTAQPPSLKRTFGVTLRAPSFTCQVRRRYE